jgi:glycerol-3-phosphate acyltransferase PlsY
MSNAILYLLMLIVGYLFGSILFAKIITNIVKGKDIRDIGNNNPGAANTFKEVGPFYGILAGLLDACKGLIPILIAYYFFHLSNIALAFLGCGAVLGHAYPLYFGFKGGRSASTIMGVYLFFIPLEFAIGFIIGPILVYAFIKSNRSYWIPFLIILVSAIVTLFLNHSTETKIIVWAIAFVGLLINSFHLLKMAREHKEQHVKN